MGASMDMHICRHKCVCSMAYKDALAFCHNGAASTTLCWPLLDCCAQHCCDCKQQVGTTLSACARDSCLTHGVQELLDAVDELGGRWLVTADHGNAECMVCPVLFCIFFNTLHPLLRPTAMTHSHQLSAPFMSVRHHCLAAQPELLLQCFRKASTYMHAV